MVKNCYLYKAEKETPLSCKPQYKGYNLIKTTEFWSQLRACTLKFQQNDTVLQNDPISTISNSKKKK